MIRLLKELVSRRTISSAPEKREFEEASAIIQRGLEELGFKTKVFRFRDELPVVFGEFLRGKEEKTVTFVTHYDVVPAEEEGWMGDPFKPKLKDGKVFGRGAADAKAGIVAFLKGFEELLNEEVAPRFNVKFFSFPDEEIGGEFGVKAVARKKPKLLLADGFYILDCSTEGIQIGACGVVHGRLTILGRSGHSAYPFRCENAAEASAKVIMKLLEFKKKEERRTSKRLRAPPNPVRKNVWNRFSVTIVRAGEKVNVIPGRGEVSFDWRLIPEDEPGKRISEFKRYLEEIGKKLGVRMEVEARVVYPGYRVSEDDEFVAKLKESVETVKGEKPRCICALAATDGNFLYEKFGKPAFGFGPFDEDSNIHGVNEFIRISTLKIVKSVVKEFLK